MDVATILKKVKPCEFELFFRFTKEQFTRLCDLFQIPAVCLRKMRSKYDGVG